MDEIAATGLGEEDRVAQIRGVVAGIHLTMKTAASHGIQHPLTAQAGVDTAHAIAESKPPLALQFIGQATFCNRTLVPFDVQGFHVSQQLAAALLRLDLHEVEFELGFTAEDAVALAGLLARGPAGGAIAAAWEVIPHVQLASLPGARTGLERVDVDPEVLAATHVSLAVSAAEGLVADAADSPWNWRTGMAVVRRLTRAIQATTAGTQSALELVPGPWTPARRAVGSVLHVLLVLTDLGVATATARAAAHAVLALAVRGMKSRSGVPVDQAATALLPSLLQRPATQTGAVEPHIIRVCSLVHLLTTDSKEDAAGDPIVQLVGLGYEIERRRCPQGTNIDLSLLDCLAWAVKAPASFGQWPLLLTRAAGVIPPGSRVRLADGSVAIVLETDPTDPFRPSVLVAGQVRRCQQPVTLLSAALQEGT